MFEQLKQLKKLQEIQKALKDERVEYEKQGIKVTINGKLEIEDIKLNPAMAYDQQEKMLKEVLNEGMKKIQMTVAQKMQAMGGLGFWINFQIPIFKLQRNSNVSMKQTEYKTVFCLKHWNLKHSLKIEN